MKPRKKRSVLFPPNVQSFRPGGALSGTGSVKITIDEYEALRLADHERLKHLEAARHMDISRPTFTRLLASARAKIGDAIVNGKAIEIEGGNFRFLGKRYRCRGCGANWDVPEDKISPQSCPDCDKPDVEDVGKEILSEGSAKKKGRFGHGWNKKKDQDFKG
jgi:uncharacterized protein